MDALKTLTEAMIRLFIIGILLVALLYLGAFIAGFIYGVIQSI